MKKLTALLVVLAVCASFCSFAFADNYFRVVGNDGDVYYIYDAGSDLYLTNNGIKFYMSGVKGEYVSEYGYYFHDASYVRGTGHETMPYVPGKSTIVAGRTYRTYVSKGYLALRSNAAYDTKNEIGPLWNGSTVMVNSYSGGQYAYVTVYYRADGAWGPNVAGCSGYVDVNYLY